MVGPVNSRRSGKSVLFFGRSKCRASEYLLEELKKFGFDVTLVKSETRGEKISEDILSWEGDYILCFRSLYILPKRLLDNAKIAAINFHPAPPEYPGSGCTNFALYDEVKEYGVTAHLMNERVDNGLIIEVKRFPVRPSDNLPSLLSRTHDELACMCLNYISGIFSEGQKFLEKKISASKNERWSGKARRLEELEELKKVPLTVSEEKLRRIIRATYIEGYPPMIELHGFNFYLKMEK